MDQFSLSGKTIVLTGAAGYIGSYYSRGLLESGAKLVIIDYPGKSDGLFAELLKRYGSKRIFRYETDFYDTLRTQACFEGVSAEHLRVDVLINNAWDFSKRTGFNHPAGRLDAATHDQLAASFESGIWWAIQATQHFGMRMRTQGEGNIINICTMYAEVVPSPHLYTGTDKFNPPGYSMAKAGLLQFTRYTASFFGPQVRANALSPGAFPNVEGKTDNAVSPDDAEFLQRLADRTLLGRIGHPRDLVGPLIFLASDASAYITGANIQVDGGWTIT